MSTKRLARTVIERVAFAALDPDERLALLVELG